MLLKISTTNLVGLNINIIITVLETIYVTGHVIIYYIFIKVMNIKH